MFFRKKATPGLSIFSYMIGDPKTKKMAVIDPVRDVGEFTAVSKDAGYEITDILETHVHADFISGAKELKAALDGKPRIHCSGLGGDQWTPSYADRVVDDGGEVILGQIRLKARHSPGHTPEHILWELYDDEIDKDSPLMIFSGDFLFVGSIGRPDLLGEKEQEKLSHALYRSVFGILPQYDDKVEVYPAHGEGSLCGKAISGRESTTVGEERKSNPSLKKMPEPEWIEQLLADMPPMPSYFSIMKRVNAQGPDLLAGTIPGLKPLSMDEFDAIERPFLLDVRPDVHFAKQHIPGSLNIPTTERLALWAGWTVPYDRPLVIIKDEDQDEQEIVWQLTRIGLDNIRGFVDGGVAAWKKSGRDVGSLKTLTIQEAAQKVASGENLFILDVRTPSEWEEGHLEGAFNIHAGELSKRVDEVPTDRPVGVVCGGGMRSSIAASYLLQLGRKNVCQVLGGMRALQ